MWCLALWLVSRLAALVIFQNFVYANFAIFTLWSHHNTIE